MGGGGQNIGGLGGGPPQWGGIGHGGDPYGGAGFGQGNQGQRNFINAQGKLPGGLGGGALTEGQQNFFQNKGYLPPGFTGGQNMGFLGNQPPKLGGAIGQGQPAQWGGGYPLQGGNDYMSALQHMFGGGTNFGPYTNWM